MDIAALVHEAIDAVFGSFEIGFEKDAVGAGILKGVSKRGVDLPERVDTEYALAGVGVDRLDDNREAQRFRGVARFLCAMDESIFGVGYARAVQGLPHLEFVARAMGGLGGKAGQS